MSPAMIAGFGTESTINRIEIAVLSDYDDALVKIDQRQAPEDEARALAREAEYEPITTPGVSAENIHPGALPSFIQTADEYRFYPLVAIVPDMVVKSAEDPRNDQLTVFQNSVTIHVMSRTDVDIPATDAVAAQLAQTLVERRVIRMAEAMRLVVRTNVGMRKLFGNDADPIRQLIAEPWKFPVQDRKGKDYMFCSVGMEFQIKNYSPPEEV